MRIAVTAIGCLCADHVATPQILPTIHKEWPVGEVCLTNEQLAKRVRVLPDGNLSRNSLLALVAASEALDDAKLTNAQTADLLFINGTTVGGMDLTERHFADWMNGQPVQPEILSQHEAHATTLTVRQFLGFAPEPLTISTACSSALNAIIVGAEHIRKGTHTRVLVGGTEALTLFHLNGFGSLGILSEQVCRPFSPDRDGINLGEGAAYLLLEEESAALARGAHIYGYVAGYGNRCDAYHQTASSPEGEGAFLAMQDALTMAGLQPDDIDYLNAHGTATPNNDASESRAVERLFGRPLLYNSSPNLGEVAAEQTEESDLGPLTFDRTKAWPEPVSTKHITGHTTSASGAIEAVFCLRLMAERGYRYVMTNAFAFGGNDSSLIFSSLPVSVGGEHNVAEKVLCKTVPPTKWGGGASEARVLQGTSSAFPSISPLQLRRLTPQLRTLLAAAQQALTDANLTTPDAIIVSTRWGGITPTVALLKSLAQNGEHDFSPSLFMQSTHNTPATTLARLLACQGYNITFCPATASTFHFSPFTFHLRPKAALVCTYDEPEPTWAALLAQAGITLTPAASATILDTSENS